MKKRRARNENPEGEMGRVDGDWREMEDDGTGKEMQWGRRVSGWRFKPPKNKREKNR